MSRNRFDEEIKIQSDIFTQKLLDDVPELSCVAIIFGYQMPNHELTYAVTRGQNGPVNTPAEVIELLRQIWRTFKFHTDLSYDIIKGIDDHMLEQSRELANLQQQIKDAKQELGQLTSRTTTTDGNPG